MVLMRFIQVPFVILFYSTSWLVFAAQQETFKNVLPDVNLVYRLAKLSKRIYKISDINDSNVPNKFIDPIFFSETPKGIEVILGKLVGYDATKYVVVVFRGSDEAIDWWGNINIKQTTLGPSTNKFSSAGRVHRGWNNHYFRSGLAEKIGGIVEDYVSRGYQVIFSGHSMGAAYAKLSGVYMAATSMKDENVSVITFGEPRVGDESFKIWAQSLENLCMWRVVNKNDVVARVPLFDYRHSGHLIQLEDDGAKAYYEQTGDKGLGMAGVPSGWNSQTGMEISAHLMDGYLEYISGKSLSQQSIFWADQYEKEKVTYVSCTWYDFFWC